MVTALQGVQLAVFSRGPHCVQQPSSRTLWRMTECEAVSSDGSSGLHGQYLSDQIQAAGTSRPSTDGWIEAETATEASSVSNVSTYTRIMQNYSIRFWDPSVCCKLRKRTPRLTYGIDGLVNPSPDQERFSLLLKPVPSKSWKSSGHWVDKVTLKTTRLSAQVFTPKITIGFVRLQVMVCLGPRGVSDLAWRFSTQWSRTAKPPLLKPSIRLRTVGIDSLPNLEIRPHIKCDIFSPEVCGRVGGAADMETGHAHISVPRLHIRYEIGGGLFPEGTSSSADLGEGSNAADKWVDDTVQNLVPTSQHRWPSSGVVTRDATLISDAAHPKRRRRFGL